MSSAADETENAIQPAGPDLSAARAVLRDRFGYPSFRDGQEDAIAACLAARDLLVVMPTGSGKSLCYQLPALLQPGFALVVSPLIALMKDQVDQLRGRGIRAGTVHSGVTVQDKWEVVHGIRDGTLDLLLVAPERLASPRFVRFLQQHPPARVAIDEAHCISQWGHDFRPDYLRLRGAVEALGRPPVSALTATATPAVRDDIRHQLGLRQPVEVLTGFDRPNLSFEVLPVTSQSDKLDQLRALVEATQGLRLVYAASRRSVEQVAAGLGEGELRAAGYHAGLSDLERSRIQDRFMAGELDVLVATNAFGMGVDKPDIRLVVHYDMPGSLEAYYQEAGRAGRDGAPARCVLLQWGGDYRLQRFFVDGSNPSPELIGYLWSELRRRGDEPLHVDQLRPPGGHNSTAAVQTALRMLRRQDVLDGDDSTVQVRGQLPARCPIDPAALREKRRRDEQRLAAMLDYARSRRECRLARIRHYFLGRTADPCGRCDVCRGADQPLRTPDPEDQRRLRAIVQAVASLPYSIGAARLAKLLAGSRAADIVERGLDRLGTHGALRAEGERQVRDLLQFAEDHDLLRRVAFTSRDGTRSGSVLELGDAGRALLAGDVPELPPLPAPAPAASPPRARRGTTTPPEGADAALYEALRTFRVEQAAGKPAYTVFSNEVLAELVMSPPRDEASFLRVKGLGPKRWRIYGPALLACIRACRAEP